MNAELYTFSISVIIPALNEEKYIGATLESIKICLGKSVEIILVDNGSSDRTVEIAKEHGASTIIERNITIAGLRNLGAKSASGNVLVFIDADVSMHTSWLNIFKEVYPTLPDDGLWITGSRCQTPYDDFINTYWYRILNHKETGYINSGHLIISRPLFELLGGFDYKLKTSEDHDICSRAISVHASIIHQPNLVVFHYGYPKTVVGFFKRELWHGKSDFNSVSAFTKSKIAMASIILLAINVIGLTLGLLSTRITPIIASIVFSYCISAIFVKYKFKNIKTSTLIITAWIQLLYFLARSLSWLTSFQSIKKSNSQPSDN